MGMGVRKLQEMLVDREAWLAAVHGVAVRHDRLTERQSVVFTALVLFPLVVCFPIYCVDVACFYAVVSSGF